MYEVPGRDADELDWLIFEQAGVLTSAQAREVAGRSAVRTHLRQRRWRAICRGVLSTQNGALTRRQQLWVAVLVAGRGARLAGSTSAAEHCVTGLQGEPVHVIVPADRNRSTLLPALPPDMAGVRVHRTAVLPHGMSATSAVGRRTPPQATKPPQTAPTRHLDRTDDADRPRKSCEAAPRRLTRLHKIRIRATPAGATKESREADAARRPQPTRSQHRTPPTAAPTNLVKQRPGD
jgi:hypothetical protein